MTRAALLAVAGLSAAALLASLPAPSALTVTILAAFVVVCPGLPFVCLTGLDRDVPLAVGLTSSLSLAVHGLLATTALALGGLPATELVRGTAIVSLGIAAAALVRDARPSAISRGPAAYPRSRRLSVLRPAELGPAELAAWRDLQRGSLELSSAFLAGEFTLAVAEERDDARVAVLEDEGGLAGFLPYQEGRFGVGRPIAAGLTEVQGAILRPGSEWDLPGIVRAAGLALVDFDRLLGSQAPPRISTRWRAPIVELDGGYDAYLAACKRRSRKIVSDTFYKLRRLEREHGPVWIENRAGDPDALRIVLGWKSDQYRRTGLSDRFASAWVRQLVERLSATRTPEFSGSLPVLVVDGRAVAGHVMLRSGPVLTGWFPAYDPAFARFSPGLILRLLTARAAAESGVQVIELGREGGDYKERLKTGDRDLVEAVVGAPGAILGLHRLRHEPPRRLRAYVVQHPRAYEAARRSVAWTARARDRFR